MTSFSTAATGAARADARPRDADAAVPAGRRIPVGLLAALVLGTLACIGVACIVCRSLYGDGAYVVLGRLLRPMRFDDYDYHRSFASFIGQAPLFLGQRLGIVN